jgi:N-methylhydantoinase B
MIGGEVDPFTFEIIRHKLFRVTEEAVIALESVSGTPITAEGHDLMVSLYRKDGGLMVGGTGFLQHITSASQAVKHILANFSDDPGIYEDDVYLMNDPYTGALHAPDVYLISPIHWQGKIAGFVADFVHVTDIGGIDPGGFCPSARSSYQEGFASKGLKLVERGKLRKDVFETILNLVRDPGLVGLDLKSMMAANHVAKQRMLKLYSDYGYETVDAVSNVLITQSERLIRQRLLEIPNGTWRARQYYELPDRVLPIELVAIKQGDSLTFDFSGAPEQAPNGINCSYWATWGALFASLFPVLAYDMVWNDGIFKCVKMIAPERTMVNALRPAPVSMATIGAVQIVRNLTLNVLAKMLGASEKHHRRVTGLWPTNMTYHLTGTTLAGEYLSSHATDSFAGSGGARSFRDGVDVGGLLHALSSRSANVERHEMNFPHRYLFRRMVPDSGGPGKYRGGVCHEFAVVPHRIGADKFTAVLMPGRGMESLNSRGVSGGYPGCNTACVQYRGVKSNAIPYDLTAVQVEREERIVLGVTDIHVDDVQYIRYDGAGGYGDPLDRDPELVLKDVTWGLVTEEPARDIYGVVLAADKKNVDYEATKRQRSALRAERLGGRTPKCDTDRASVPRTRHRINEYLQVCNHSNGGAVQCTWCGTDICSSQSNWKEHAVVRKSPPSKAGPLRVESGKFFLLEFFCPGCGTVLDVDVAYRDDPPLIDHIASWPS